MRTSIKFCVAVAAFASLLTSVSTASAQSIDEEMENYWTVERDLPVVQERLYERDGSFGVGLYTGLMSSEPFYWYVPVGGRLSYFLSNHFGLEVGGQYQGLAFPTEIHSFIERRLGDAFNPDTDLEDRFEWRANAVALWSPFYGKWAFLNNKLSHFDLNLALGAGAVSVVRPNYLRTESSNVVTGELVFGGGLNFFLSELVTLRLDGRFYVYQGADTPSRRADYDPQDQAQASDESSFLRRLQVPSEFHLGVHFNF